MKFPDKDQQHEEDSSRWIIPYADVVTLMFALFVVLFAAADSDRAEQLAEVFKHDETAQIGAVEDSSQLRDKIQEELSSIPGVTVTETKRKITYSLDGTVIFEPGKSNLEKASLEAIKQISKTLINETSHIAVEGHTDNTPISNSKYPSNWELSTARAATVLRALIDNNLEPKRLSAAGYGGYRPIGTNQTEEGRMKNRRVDIVVTK